MCLSFRKHTHISMTTYTHKCVFKMNRMKSAGLNKDENRRQKVYLSGGKIFFNLIYYSYVLVEKKIYYILSFKEKNRYLSQILIFIKGILKK